MTGTVRVTGVTPFTLTYVLPLIPAFTGAHPNVRVELDLEDNLTDMIGQGYDVGIRVGRVSSATVIARRIAVLPFVVCAAPDYLARHAPLRTPADLEAHNCLQLRHRASGRLVEWTLVRKGEQATPSVRGNFVSNDLTALITAAIHGQGLVCAPLPRILPLLRDGDLRVVLPDWLFPGIEVFLHYPSRKGLPARVKAFVAFVLDALRKNPDLQTDPHVLLAPFRRGATRVRP
jgi:DNA-binding transcriptional LysR family regulator